MADQHKIWHHFQNAAPDSFAAARPRLDFLLQQVAKRDPLLSRDQRSRGAARDATNATDGRGYTGGPAVLNIGIGDGYFERQAQARGWQVHSLDPDEQATQKLVADGIAAQVGRIEQLPHADQSLDFVVASEVLEHLTEEQRRAGLAEIARVLRPGGWFLGSVPHAENLAEQMTVCPQCGEVFHRWGHQASFTLESVRTMLAERFAVDGVGRSAFVAVGGRGLRGAVKALVRIALAKLGEPIAVPTIWWVARRRG